MKKTLLTILQLAVTGALLYWVFHDPAVRAAMAVAIREADYRWIAAAILAYIVVEVARRRPLANPAEGSGHQPEHSARRRVCFLIGMFYNQFLPGGTGGDIVKTYLLWKETPGKKPGALLAVLFDRMIGLIALIIITGVLIFLRYDWLDADTGDDVALCLARARCSRQLGLVCRQHVSSSAASICCTNCRIGFPAAKS